MPPASARLRALRIARHGGRLALAAVLALGLVVDGTGPLAGQPLLGGAPAAVEAGVTYVRVADLRRPVRATRMQIHRLGINVPIRDGTLGGTLSWGYAYHYPTTSWPGGRSNTYLYGHARADTFFNLWYARVGDVIVMRLETGRFVKYRVTGTYRVAWNDGRWVLPTRTDRLTLQTCLGSSLTSPRLVVVAVPAY